MIFESKFNEFDFGKLIWNQMTIDLDFHLVTLPLYTENDPNAQFWLTTTPPVPTGLEKAIVPKPTFLL